MQGRVVRVLGSNVCHVFAAVATGFSRFLKNEDN
jgi:hypothetical protein